MKLKNKSISRKKINISNIQPVGGSAYGIPSHALTSKLRFTPRILPFCNRITNLGSSLLNKKMKKKS